MKVECRNEYPSLCDGVWVDKMRIAICDDDKKIAGFLGCEIQNGFKDSFSIVQYAEPSKLLTDWELTRKTADIVIMDIEFYGYNGVEAAKRIHEIYGTNIEIIFITGYPERVSEIFRVQPTFLLMKPISRELLFEAITKARELIAEEKENAIYVSFKGNMKRINVRDIRYIESNRKKAMITLINGTEETIQKLDEIEKQLPDYFLRCHQSFLVNMTFIRSITNCEIEVMDGKLIPISRSKAKYVKDRFMEFLSFITE